MKAQPFTPAPRDVKQRHAAQTPKGGGSWLISPGIGRRSMRPGDGDTDSYSADVAALGMLKLTEARVHEFIIDLGGAANGNSRIPQVSTLGARK